MGLRRPGRAEFALLLGSTIFSLLAIELGLRLFNFQYSPVKIEVHGVVTDWRFKHSFEDGHFEFDPLQIWRPRAGRKVFNALRYRGELLGPSKRDGELRILAVGDSNTLGWASDSVHWPGYLEQNLRAEGFDVRVINAGVWGHSSFQGLARLDEYMPLHPDVVLISYGGNDAHRVYVSDARYVAEVATSPSRIRLYRWGIGRLLLALRDRMGGDVPTSDDRSLVHRVSPAEYEANLRQMVETARTGGARPYLLTRPFVGESPTPEWWKNFAPIYLESTRSVGRGLGVPVIDVYAAFADQPEWFEDESHFTEAGHRRAATLIGDPIARDLRRGLAEGG